MTRLRWWLLAFAIWTVMPLLQTVQEYVYASYLNEAFDWQRRVPLRVVDWYTCAIFTPVCFWLARRFPFERRTWLRGVLAQLSVICVVVVAKWELYLIFARQLRPQAQWYLSEALARGFVSESIAMWSLLGIVHAIEYHRRYREREVQAVRLEAELVSARLDALSAQLQPHFLFNTLHSISTLMRRDPDAADEMLAHLGDLLHRTLRRGDRHEVTLAEELELLRHYLGIMQIRFHDRLTIGVDVDESLTASLVPPLILQPLVENAIQHGISRKPGAGRIDIAARRDAQMLEIRVRDDGEGRGDDSRDGIGLTNTRRRLQQLYGENHALELLPAGGGGLEAILHIPLHTS